MKYIYFFVVLLLGISEPDALFAHDGSNHATTGWYQDTTTMTMLVGSLLVSMLLAGGWYTLPRYRKLLAGVGITSFLIGFVALGMNQHPAITVPISDSVAASLRAVPVTVYRTEGCTCCGKFAKELSGAGANVTIETIKQVEMRDVKNQYQIASAQESCHTSVIEGYAVEGHVPFSAIAKLLNERPAITGITLPGMPVGTPGMPGQQTQVYTVTTLDNELFWQST